MKHSIINWVLGASLIIAAPVALADNWKQNNKQHKKQHKSEKHLVLKTKPHASKHSKRHNKKHWRKHQGKHSVFQSHSNNYAWSNPSRWNDRQDYRQRIHQRQNTQARKIRKGVHKGQLVHWEEKQLRTEQHRIDKRLARFRHDGRLNRYERNKIHKMLDVATNNIRNKRHNRITRRSQHNRYDRNHYDRNPSYEFVINW